MTNLTGNFWLRSFKFVRHSAYKHLEKRSRKHFKYWFSYKYNLALRHIRNLLVMRINSVCVCIISNKFVFLSVLHYKHFHFQKFLKFSFQKLFKFILWNYYIWYMILVYFGEGNGTPLQYSCLENPMDGGPWKAAVHGVAKSWTRLSDFTFTFPFHALEKEMATHSSVLAWRVPGTGEPGGLPSLGSHRVGHDWSDLAAAAATSIFIRLIN